jgi:hypothetical protein
LSPSVRGSPRQLDDRVAEFWYGDEAVLARAGASPQMKRLTDDGTWFIGRITSYVIEEKQIIP